MYDVNSILMFGSGIPTAEKPTAKKFFMLSNGPDSNDGERSYDSATDGAWDRYKQYLKSTSILVPIPPVVYRRLPEVVKRTVLMDWGIYRFRENKVGEAAIVEARG